MGNKSSSTNEHDQLNGINRNGMEPTRSNPVRATSGLGGATYQHASAMQSTNQSNVSTGRIHSSYNEGIPSGGRMQRTNQSNVSIPSARWIQGANLCSVSIPSTGRIQGTKKSDVGIPSTGKIQGANQSNVGIPSTGKIQGANQSDVGIPSTARIQRTNQSNVGIPSTERIQRTNQSDVLYHQNIVTVGPQLQDSNQVGMSNTDNLSSGLPFSLQNDTSENQGDQCNSGISFSGLPFHLNDEASVHQGKSNVDITSSNLPFSAQDDTSANQVDNSNVVAISNGLPFSLQDETSPHQVDKSKTQSSSDCHAPPVEESNNSSDVTADASQNIGSGAEAKAEGQAEKVPVHPPSKLLNEKECLVCITLPGAVDWDVALDELQYTLNRFEFKLQDVEKKPSNLHSKHYVLCFADKEDVPWAMHILKDRKIKATTCEEVIDSFINNILEKKDTALKSHQTQCEEVMQRIDSFQTEKKGTKRSHVKFISLDKFDKRNAEKEALKQKAIELNGQTKEFAELVSKLVERIYSMKAVKINWKELNSEIKELKQLLEREKDRLEKALPIYAKKSLITNTVKNNQVSIILGETGSGKSTQVVQYLYDSGLAEKGAIVCTQPRKVAAFSLEKYVCEEMKDSGHIVECSVGGRSIGKKEKQAKILFTTDYWLLMECIKDRDLKRFSCVIIDEAHERNINTDLLLGIIKKALPRRPDLRIIITSATINPDLFVKYFGDSPPVVRVSGKTFPVEVEWKKKQEKASDYVLEAVEKVVEIHENEGAGDVLVFLTCPAEIEQACTKVSNRIKKDNILILPLHGKLQQEEQRAVFDPTPEGKRKVVFATNCAETSLTIDGIKFVVDTGKAKEMKYDPKRNLNSLEISVISQSSADQRKGRAGRTQSGKCFRLYTEDDFKAMEKSSKPEILRVNLGQALLKLMELGISNPAEFDYVESPPVESIRTAVMELSDLGAICDGQLTELGKKMAKIPVDPGLAKFLFEGFEQGVGYEALVLVSVATITGSVFFRMGTEEEKKAADSKKVEFCHLGGDFMTLLDVYRSWQKVDKRDRNRWCFEKSLNAKAMRMANETVKDLKSTLKHELKICNIDWSSLDKETTDARLQKTLFSCFMTKLCVYTGHERKGYKTITGGHFVKIHPSSSINFTGSNPQFIVYEKILKTSQDFLLNVTPIEKSWLQESIAEKKIDVNIEDVLDEVLMVTPPISMQCSSIIVRRAFEPFKNKLPNLEESISKSCNGAPIVIEAKRNCGKVKLFVPKKYSDTAMNFAQLILEVERGKLRKETQEHPVIAESPALKVVLEKGLTVQQILMPNMYRSVVVRNMQDDAITLHCDAVKYYLCQFGKLIDFNFGSNMYFATYEKPEEARQAVELCACEELGFKVMPKKPRQNNNSSNFNFRVEITWHRREPKGMGNVSFVGKPDEAWHEVSWISSLKIGPLNVARVRKDKHNEKTLFLMNLSSTTTQQGIKTAMEESFPGIEIHEQDIRIQYKQRGTIADTQKQKTFLETLITEYATPGSFEVTVKEIDVSNKTIFGVAKVDFLSPNEGIQVVRRLSGKKCTGLENWPVYLDVKPYLNFFDTCLKDVYDLVREDIKSKMEVIATECAEKCNQRLQLKEKTAKFKGRIALSVETRCLDHYVQASKAVSKCIQGERIECRESALFLLGKDGRDQLKEIQKETGALICTDERTMAITLYGTSEQKDKARDAVYKLLQDLVLKGNTLWEINLKEEGRPRGLLKEIMSKYGRQLEGLLEIPGVSKVDIHFNKQVLKIQSTTDAKTCVHREIEEIAKTMAPVQPKTENEIEEETCPTCFCEIDSETTFYRLATCGHAYCIVCIKQQLNAAVFPLCCTHENCQELFTLQDMKDLLTEKEKELLDNVMKMSLKSFVDANHDKARYCPTPDCPMVYLVTTEGKLFRCNVCSAAICSSCHEPYHLGLTCKENEIEKKDPGKASFDKWMNEKPGRRKRCPKCTAPIEKNGGCNHMECIRCKSHICWPCMKVFGSGSEVYDHQRSCTGKRED